MYMHLGGWPYHDFYAGFIIAMSFEFPFIMGEPWSKVQNGGVVYAISLDQVWRPPRRERTNSD